MLTIYLQLCHNVLIVMPYYNYKDKEIKHLKET